MVVTFCQVAVEAGCTVNITLAHAIHDACKQWAQGMSY
jgi:hypothetical protein